MKRRTGAALLAAAAVAAPSASAAHIERVALPDTSRAEVASPEALEQAIAASVNALRRRHRLRPLVRSRLLARAAGSHAAVLAQTGTFTHDWPDGRPFARWIPSFYRQSGFRVWRAGENLLWSTGELTPAAALELWLASPPHRRVLLTPSWRELGIGVVHARAAAGVYGGQDVYVVAAEFGART